MQKLPKTKSEIMETKTTNDILIYDKSCKDFKERELHIKWIKVKDLEGWIDDNRYLIHECNADVIDTKDLLKELK